MRQVEVISDHVRLAGDLTVPEGASGLVIFAHGSGSSRLSPRNRFVAEVLQDAGLGTLLFDLLTPEEERVDIRTGHLRFNIQLLAERLDGATDWVSQEADAEGLRIGYFGASTGAAAALVAAAGRTDIGAVVSRGGRPDLAGSALSKVQSPTLLVVGGEDFSVIPLNQDALKQMTIKAKELVIVPGATHLFEEPGSLEEVSRLARDWLLRYLGSAEKAKSA